MGRTTLRIYRLIFKEGRPLTLSEIQEKAKLSSASVAHYHVSKLLDSGLLMEKDGGYVVEKMLFENMIRVRRSFIPLQLTFAIFFGTTLAGILLILRPVTMSSLYILALVVNAAAFGIFVYQTVDTLKRWKA